MKPWCVWPLTALLLSGTAKADPTHDASSAEGGAVVDDASRRALAREWFATGLSLARARQYAAAKALFTAAYEIEPHYLVLYNIGQAELQLGEHAAAAGHLRRFLADGGTQIDDERRQATLTLLAQIEGEPEAAPERAAPAQAAEAAHETSLLVDASSVSHHGAMEQPDGVDKSSTAPVWSYVMTGGGFALLGGAAALYLWNHERYEKWQRENVALQSDQSALLMQGMDPAGSSPLKTRVRANNALLASVKTFDPVPIITGVAGLVALGTGIWSFASNQRGLTVELGASASDVHVGTCWLW